MARTDTLGHFLTDVASAIKDKKGDDTAITAADFDTEIANLPAGGGKVKVPFISFNLLGYTGIDWTDFDFNALDLSDCTYLYYTFGYFNGPELKLRWDVNKVTTVQYMFTSTNVNCKTIDLRTMQFRGLTSSANMFYLTNAEVILMPDFNPDNRIAMDNMFYGCKNIKLLDLSSLDIVNKRSSGGPFYNNTRDMKIIALDEANKSYYVSNVTGGNSANVKTRSEAIAAGWIDSEGNCLI